VLKGRKCVRHGKGTKRAEKIDGERNKVWGVGKMRHRKNCPQSQEVHRSAKRGQRLLLGSTENHPATGGGWGLDRTNLLPNEGTKISD